MRYVVEVNYIRIIGRIWLPPVICAQELKLSDYDIGNIGELTRESVEHWLSTNAGDFQSIEDFSFSIKDTDVEWSDEESEFTYSDLMFPHDD